MPLATKKLTRKHDRKGFDCGHEGLNKYLQTRARNDADRDISRTFVLSPETDESVIIGFYTLVYCSIQAPPESPLKNYPHELAGLKIARLGVDETFKGQGFGEFLLVDALKKALFTHEAGGAPIIGVFVDAKDLEVRAFYEKYGFIVVNESDDELCLWLPIGTCKQLLS